MDGGDAQDVWGAAVNLGIFSPEDAPIPFEIRASYPLSEAPDKDKAAESAAGCAPEWIGESGNSRHLRWKALGIRAHYMVSRIKNAGIECELIEEVFPDKF